MRLRPLSILGLLMLTVLLQACAPKNPSAETDCGFVQNVYGQRISWKNTGLIPLSVHQSFPDEMMPALEGAIKNWESVAGRPLFQIVATHVAGPIAPQKDGMNLIYWMPTWEADKSTEQARTSVYWVGNQINEADIRLNAKDFKFYLDTPQSYADVHLESLLVHELGHVLGLKHRDDGGSVMATYLASKTIRDNIGDADRTDLKCEY